jgi:hypothetical protein
MGKLGFIVGMGGLGRLGRGDGLYIVSCMYV